jgi:hypothetical protein
VLEVFRGEAFVVCLHVAGRVIRTTAEHPFWVAGLGWVPAEKLTLGQLLSSHDGNWLPVEAVTFTGECVPVYNIRVEEDHTYFVGCDEWGFSVWAHNACLVVSQWNTQEQRELRPGERRIPRTTNHFTVEIIPDDGPPVHVHQYGAVGTRSGVAFWTNPNARPLVGSRSIEIKGPAATRALAFVTAEMALPERPYNVVNRSCTTFVWDVLTAAGVTAVDGAGPMPPRPVLDNDLVGAMTLIGWLRHVTGG